MTKKSGQYLDILRTKKAFNMKQKAFVIIFEGLSLARNCLRAESGPLIEETNDYELDERISDIVWCDAGIVQLRSTVKVHILEKFLKCWTTFYIIKKLNCV